MEGGERESAPDAPAEDDAASSSRRVAPGQVWIACAQCGRTIELAEAEESVEGHVCPECAGS
jgi:hypothetical protein